MKRTRNGWASATWITNLVILFSCGTTCSAERNPVSEMVDHYCIDCHSDGDDSSGGVDLQRFGAHHHGEHPGADQTDYAELLLRVTRVLRTNQMPPETEPPVVADLKRRVESDLQRQLDVVCRALPQPKTPIARLNRWQYNFAVRDLFQLDRNVFALPEKRMTRLDSYLQRHDERMPDVVEVASESLRPQAGLREVVSFPKDLRAAHGFDNQADQLTLSPLLLDAFLRLSVSIVESPDFNQQTVGRWSLWFQEPASGEDVDAAARERTEQLLRLAFRQSVDGETVGRYTEYLQRQLSAGKSFPQAMKKLASAVLSSPLFLFRVHNGTTLTSDDRAARLSFLLWSSGPDERLLTASESGELDSPEGVRRSVRRMLQDRKVERFLDTFPTQWLQLENLFAATPDPTQHRFYSLDRNHPASLQMIVEPLLLFDAAFIENWPVHQLISPRAVYRSDFLNRWYSTDLSPPVGDEADRLAKNEIRTERLENLHRQLKRVRRDLIQLEREIDDPITHQLVDVDLEIHFLAWQQHMRQVLDERPVHSNWYRIGPFMAGSFDDAFNNSPVDAGNVDLDVVVDGKRWNEKPEYVDGRSHELMGDLRSYYLYRTVDVPTARETIFSLGSDDGFRFWVNGKEMAKRQIVRGVAADQELVQVTLNPGKNELLFKIVNSQAGFGFYFRDRETSLPMHIVTALQTEDSDQDSKMRRALREYHRSVAPELEEIRKHLRQRKAELEQVALEIKESIQLAPKSMDGAEYRAELGRQFDDQIRSELRSTTFRRAPLPNGSRYGGIVTNAATLTMTSGPERTHPIARGAWVIEVLFNDPPPPPPNDVPPLTEIENADTLTVRERFAMHREHAECAGCHARLDPLGFALENFDVVGRWREMYPNGRRINAEGTLMRRRPFHNATEFKEAIAAERTLFVEAFVRHLLRYALGRELRPPDNVAVQRVMNATRGDEHRLRSLIEEIATAVAL